MLLLSNRKKKCYIVKHAYCSKIYLLTAVQDLNVSVASVFLVSIFQVFHVVISNTGQSKLPYRLVFQSREFYTKYCENIFKLFKI